MVGGDGVWAVRTRRRQRSPATTPTPTLLTDPGCMLTGSDLEGAAAVRGWRDGRSDPTSCSNLPCVYLLRQLGPLTGRGERAKLLTTHLAPLQLTTISFPVSATCLVAGPLSHRPSSPSTFGPTSLPSYHLWLGSTMEPSTILSPLVYTSTRVEHTLRSTLLSSVTDHFRTVSVWTNGQSFQDALTPATAPRPDHRTSISPPAGHAQTVSLF